MTEFDLRIGLEILKCHVLRVSGQLVAIASSLLTQDYTGFYINMLE